MNHTEVKPAVQFPNAGLGEHEAGVGGSRGRVLGIASRHGRMVAAWFRSKAYYFISANSLINPKKEI